MRFIAPVRGECVETELAAFSLFSETGGLFRLAVGVMQVFSENTQSYRVLLDKLALYFQIRDDLLNLFDSDYHMNKSFCEDLTEGKFSFPVIHYIRSNPTDNRLSNILKQVCVRRGMSFDSSLPAV